MSPYTFLLVLALAACIVTPVLSAEAAASLGKNEERAGTHLVKRQSPPTPPASAADLERAQRVAALQQKIFPYVKAGVITTKAVITLGLVGLVGDLIYKDVGTNKPNTTNMTID